MPQRRLRRAGAVTFRHETPADAALVRDAHVAHRRDLFAAIAWPADALTRLCDQQHALQERHIATHHPGADRRMIVTGGVAIGRLCLDRGVVPWRIVDLALLPEAQGRGLGTAVLTQLIAEADRARATLALHVGRDNPRAAALYRRLGFTEAFGASETHLRLVRAPTSSPAS